MYPHRYYYRFSDLTLSNTFLKMTNSITITECEKELISADKRASENVTELLSVIAKEIHSDHEPLRAFFMTERELKLYEKLCDISNIGAHENAQDESYSIDFKENDWMKRLFKGIKNHISDGITPTLTCDYGSGFEQNILRKWSEIDDVPVKVVPFHGSPDMTVTTGSGTKLMEIADMNKLMLCKQDKLSHCPEKLGQLLAAMMTMTYCEIMKRWKSSDMSDAEHYTTHGLLLRRLGNGYIVKMEM